MRLGSRTPRVSSYPPARTSAGSEAVELAESAGLFLDPWQQDVLVASLGETPGGSWAVAEVGLIVPRQNGKGAVLEARELAGLFLFGESILHTSHEFKTSMDHYRRLERLIRGTPDLHRKVHSYPKAPGTEGIVMRDGRALRFMARTKGAGRGFPADVVVFDEAFALTEDQLAALLPTMSSRPNPQSWYTSSPPLDGQTGAPLYRLRERGEAGGPGLAWFDWGAPINADVDDRDVWAAANPALNGRISEDFVAQERAAMTPEGFGRERLGMWPVTAGAHWAVISEKDWAVVCDDPTSTARDPLVFAIDVTPERSHGSIAAVGARSDGQLHGEIVDHGQGTSWLAERAAELDKRWSPAFWVLDPGGAAGFLLPQLESAGLTVEPMSTRQVGQAYGLFRAATSSEEQAEAPESDAELTGAPGIEEAEAVVVPRIKIRPNRHLGALAAAVEGASTRRVGDGTTWDRRSNAVVISPLVALTNAMFGFVTRPVEVAAEPLVAWR